MSTNEQQHENPKTRKLNFLSKKMHFLNQNDTYPILDTTGRLKHAVKGQILRR